MEVIIAPLASALAVVVGAIISYLAAKRNIGPTATNLVSILRDTVAIQEKKISDLEKRLEESTRIIDGLRAEVAELKRVIILQQVEITKMKSHSTTITE